MIPVNVRRAIYVTLAVAGVVLGACQVGFAAVDAGQPAWLTVALAVYGFLGGSGGILAVLNTPALSDLVEDELNRVHHDPNVVEDI